MEEYQNIKFNCNAKSGKTHSSPLNMNNRLKEKQKQLEEIFKQTGEEFIKFERNEYGQLCVVYKNCLFENAPEKCVRIDSVLKRKKNDGYKNNQTQNKIIIKNNFAQLCIMCKDQLQSIVIIDIEDIPYIEKVTWYINNTGYVVGCYNGTMITIQRYILQKHNVVLNNKTVDHIDRNLLNNRKYNLRVTTYSENNKNRKSKNYYKRNGKWNVLFRIDGILTNMGIYKTEKEAHKIAYKLRKEYFKEYAWDWNLTCEESWVELHKKN